MFLVVGFFGAARQHFSSIDYGIKNSKLRKQIEELQSENRRLLLSKEIALSPGEIKKSAKQIGMVELSASNIEIFSTREEKQIKEKTVQPLVEKTVISKPVKEVAAAKPKGSEKKSADVFGKDGKPLKKAEVKTERRSQAVK